MSDQNTVTDTEVTEVCTIEDIGFKPTCEESAPLVEAFNEYLSIFSKPKKSGDGSLIAGTNSCRNCDRPLGGFLGTFRWGLCSGEGTCSNCGWPCRAHHAPCNENGEEIFYGVFEYILQYHPSVVAHCETVEP